MDEERALYIVRAGEAGAIERVLRDYSDKVKSPGPRLAVWHPRSPPGLARASLPTPSFRGCASLSPENVFGVDMRVCAPSLAQPCILQPPAPTLAPTPLIPAQQPVLRSVLPSAQVTPPESVDVRLCPVPHSWMHKCTRGFLTCVA